MTMGKSTSSSTTTSLVEADGEARDSINSIHSSMPKKANSSTRTKVMAYGMKAWTTTCQEAASTIIMDSTDDPDHNTTNTKAGSNTKNSKNRSLSTGSSLLMNSHLIMKVQRICLISTRHRSTIRRTIRSNMSISKCHFCMWTTRTFKAWSKNSRRRISISLQNQTLSLLQHPSLFLKLSTAPRSRNPSTLSNIINMITKPSKTKRGTLSKAIRSYRNNPNQWRSMR